MKTSNRPLTRDELLEILAADPVRAARNIERHTVIQTPHGDITAYRGPNATQGTQEPQEDDYKAPGRGPCDAGEHGERNRRMDTVIKLLLLVGLVMFWWAVGVLVIHIVGAHGGGH